MAVPLNEWLPPGPEQPSLVCKKDRKSPVVLDFGSWQTRIGLASADTPAHTFTTRAARYRDRRTGEPRAVAGNDILLDPTARASARSPFDGPLLTNWDAAETVLDYSFDLLGYQPKTNPVVLSEALLAPHLPHRTLQELLFEGYDVSALAFGADVLGGARYMNMHKQDGLEISIGSEATHVVPYVGGKPMMRDVRRIKWGGRHAAAFLHELLILKYPTFPSPVSPLQVESMLHDFGFVSRDYTAEVRRCMDVSTLADLERRIQAPLPPKQAGEDADKAARLAERRRESGRRLQEQAAIAREQRQAAQEEQIAALLGLEESGDIDAVLTAGFTDMNDLRKTIKQLVNTLKRARGEEIDDPPPDTPLLDTPDAELDAEGIKAKRRQRLLKASYDARQRQKAEKAAKKAEEAALANEEEQWRQRDLVGWAQTKREQLRELMETLRERERLRKDPRLKFNLAIGSVAAGKASGRKRRAEDAELEELEEDEPEEERDLEAEANALQLQLLEHDPTFSLEELTPKADWRESVVHKFLWGAHPFEDANTEQHYQLNLNIERFRACEPLFQPSIAGLDQAGLSEVVADLLRLYPSLSSRIVLTGGSSRTTALKERLLTDLRSALPEQAEINIVSSAEPELDAWRGMAQWSRDSRASSAFVSRKEYNENGADYFKEHVWGNPYH